MALDLPTTEAGDQIDRCSEDAGAEQVRQQGVPQRGLPDDPTAQRGVRYA